VTLESAAFSALATAAVRATEGCRPRGERLFDDPVIMRCLPPLWRGMVRLLCLPGLGPALLALRERMSPGVVGNLLCRTRYIDDALSRALAEDIDQVVILGAGFDTRPYRVPGVDRTHVFEVDHPATQAVKRARLERALGRLPGHVTLVPLDLDRRRLADALTGAGFRTHGRTFFVWEGVTQYITGRAVDATLRTVARNAGEESTIVFTYVWQGIIDGSARSPVEERIVSFAERVGSPWIFGLEPVGVPAYLAERGLTIIEDVGAEEYRERYLHPIGRRMKLFAGERMVAAQVAGARVAAPGRQADDAGVAHAELATPTW
jgi:methyltransferase (TIGR00027 family)